MEDKEREIRLQFLDEANEYLSTLESALLGVAQRGVDVQDMNAALRAAHSIKGGAALMGYGLTSKLAHRLEDSLKVVKIQRGEGVTSDVEGQLLNGVDAIRQIVERDRTSTPIEEHWINSTINPIFDGLYDTLGEPSAEDVASMMDGDEGQDVTPLIFQTEMEGSLERLERLLDERPNDFQRELMTLAQDLSGLGEMLELPAFIQLCQSVEHYAAGAANGQQLEEVGQSALQTWRRAQALVVTGNADSMPAELSGISFGLIDIEFDGDESEQGPGAQTFAEQVFGGAAELDGAGGIDGADEALVSDVFGDLGEADDTLVGDVFGGLGEEDDALVGDVFAGLGKEDDALVGDVFAGLGEEDAVQEGAVEPFVFEQAEATEDVDAFAGVFDNEETLQGGNKSGTEFRFSEAPKAQVDEGDLDDKTVRVSVRKLNDLNDYFGELTIERNRLEAEVKRMRGLVKDLSRKLRSLDEINDDVKDLYEQPSNQFLLAGRPQNALPGTAFSDLSSGAGATNGSGQNTAFATYQNGAEQADDPNASTADPRFRQGFDALEFDRYNDAHLPFRQIVESVVKLQEVADDIELSVDKTEQTARVIHRTARHLQRNLNQLRMRPLSDITNRFPRALRELEIEHGKSVELTLEGENTLIDRNILEALSDPMMHIVRNAFDHGIETPQVRESQGKGGRGTIAIRAFNRNNRTIITVSDDGNGINLEKIRDRAQSMGLDADLLSAASEAELLSLIFEPGFTTSDEVTSLSGRGVGMDVVRNNLTQIRGDISVDTEAGKGSTFTISVPYTLSVTRVMLAEGNRMPVALPTDLIEEVTIIDDADMYETDGKAMFHYKGDAVRLIHLSNWLAFNCPRQIDSLEAVPNIDGPSVMIFRMGEQRMGLQVDRSWGEQEVAVRRVEGPIALPAGFSNCTILGDGRVVPLVSLPDLARWVLNCEGSDINSAAALYSNPVANGAVDPFSLQTVPDRERQRRPRFLVIDDSVNVRRLLAMTLEKVGYEVIEARDGQDALDKLKTGIEVDSIVCDVEMPRMDGYSFLSKLRADYRYAEMPVTMLTSRSGDKHRNLAMNLGATAYFSKPYQERELLKSLAESLVKPEAAQTAVS
ncbi:MAG: response regulator [Cyanobacteria bacterium J06643_4]